MMSDAGKIKALNDAARTLFTGCKVLFIRGVKALPMLNKLIKLVRNYDRFSADSNPSGEHDFDSLQYAIKLVEL